MINLLLYFSPAIWKFFSQREERDFRKPNLSNRRLNPFVFYRSLFQYRDASRSTSVSDIRIARSTSFGLRLPEVSLRGHFNPCRNDNDDASVRIPLTIAEETCDTTPELSQSRRHSEGRCVVAKIHPWTMVGRHDNRHDATCVTSPRGSRDGLRYRNGALRKLSRNATPEPPFSSAECATVDFTGYT